MAGIIADSCYNQYIEMNQQISWLYRWQSLLPDKRRFTGYFGCTQHKFSQIFLMLIRENLYWILSKFPPNLWPIFYFPTAC